MPVKLGLVTEQEIRDIPVPVGKTVLEYGVIIDKIQGEIKKLGLEIVSSEYRTTATGNIVQGTIIINDRGTNNCINWSSSMDKTSKFKLGVGLVTLIGSTVMTFDDSQLNRASNMEIAAYISREISQFNNRIQLLEETIVSLVNIKVSKEIIGGIIGNLYINKDVLNISQLSMLRKELSTSKVEIDDLYKIYVMVAAVLKDSHPSSWMDDHNTLYKFFEELLDREEDKQILIEAKELAIEHKEKFVSNFQPYTPVKGVSNGVVFV